MLRNYRAKIDLEGGFGAMMGFLPGGPAPPFADAKRRTDTARATRGPFIAGTPDLFDC
jgi:hypothetical protein